jgi:hypothetical protein
MWPWKKKPSVPLPNAWTPGLWQELMNGQKQFQCFLGVDKYDVTADLIYGNHQPSFTRSYGGFIGGPETSPLRQLRASLRFTTRSSEWVFENHPAESNGYGQTNQWYDMPPCLCFTVFAAPETESIFEDLFVRAKLIGIPFLAVNIGADVLEDRPASDSNEFIRVLTLAASSFSST